MNNNTIAYLKRFYAKVEHAQQLREDLIKLVEDLESEDGCVSAELFRDLEKTNEFILSVQFENQDDYQKHLKYLEDPKGLKKLMDDLKKHCVQPCWEDIRCEKIA